MATFAPGSEQLEKSMQVPIPNQLPFHISFTGSENYISLQQERNLRFLLERYHQMYVGYIATHHGDCIQGDALFHDLTDKYASSWIRYIHPPTNPKKRAYCTGGVELPPQDYLDRDLVIALKCNVLIACPFEHHEVKRSGVWATIRYARRAKKPIIILWR